MTIMVELKLNRMIWIKLCLVNRVNSGEFDCDVLEDKEEVYNIRRLQSRTEYVSETVSIVVSALKDSAGCIDNCNPIIICEKAIKNFDGDFDDVIIDGNNTITGIYQSQHATEAPVENPYDFKTLS